MLEGAIVWSKTKKTCDRIHTSNFKIYLSQGVA